MKKLIAALLVVLASAVPSAQQTPTELVNTIKSSADLLLPMVNGGGLVVSTSAELQAALDGSAPVILLKAGTTYSGNFLAKPKATKTIVRGLTFDGRATPGLAYPKIVALDPTKAAFEVQPGANDYAFIGTEIVGGNANANVTQVGVGATSLMTTPRNILFFRDYIHPAGTFGIRGIYFNAINGSVIDSYVSGFVFQWQDSNGILGVGPGPYLIENNFIQASGENVMFGGVDPVIPGLIPSWITVRGNYFSKPASWHAIYRSTSGVDSFVWSSGATLLSGYPGATKNCFELKNARFVLIEYNVCEPVWLDAQNGATFVFTPRNQNTACTWCAVTDVLARCNVVQGSDGFAFNLLGEDDIHPPSGPGARIVIENNLVLGAKGGVMLGIAVDDVTIRGNTFMGLTNSFLSFWGAAGNDRLVVTGNKFTTGSYGIVGDAVGLGVAALNAYAPGWVMTGNIIESTPFVTYPAGNTIVAPNAVTNAWTCPQ